MKRWIMYILTACVLLSVAAPAAFATETTEATQETTAQTQPATDPAATSGTCGEGLTWVLEGTTLTISGSGEMDDGAPWAAHKKKIERVVLTGGVTRIGAEAFSGYDRLESVDFGNALVEIGERAFYNCPDLTVIHLPATFRRFGSECFRECAGLKYVYCDGGMPRFNSSCLWTGNYVVVFYPTNNPWSAEYTQPLISSYGGKLGVMMGNYDPSVEGAQEAQRETEPETQPTETTVPVTVAPETEPVTVATEPETQPTETTVPETTVPETAVPETEPETRATEPPATEAQTQPPADEEEDVVERIGSKGWIGVVAVAALVTLLAVGVLIFRSVSRKGGRYTE